MDEPIKDEPDFIPLSELTKPVFKEDRPTGKRLTESQKHNKKVMAWINLLQPIVVVPISGSTPYVKYIIEDQTLREQIELKIMAAMSKYYEGK